MTQQTSAATLTPRPKPRCLFLAKRDDNAPAGASQNHRKQMTRPWIAKTCLMWLCFIAANNIPLHAAGASSPGTEAVVSGRVLNSSTNEYVRNAEVRIQGTDQVAISGIAGSFRLTRVPAGPATLIVSYIGYEPVSVKIEVTPGEINVRDITLNRPASGGESDTVKMTKFVVSSDLEGNAKALMEQRRSMNIVNSVASDAFGDIGEGNVGEFLKFMPGIELEYVDALIRAPRLRGMEPQYTSLTIDGVTVAGADGQMVFASTDNSATGDGARSAGFESISLNNIESIEVAKTLSSDMDANAPAGAISFKTKRAFDRKGRRIAWQARLALNSNDFTLNRRMAGIDEPFFKARPGGSLEYGDVFLGNKLGVALSLNYSSTFFKGKLWMPTVSRNATESRPLVYTGMTFYQVPNFANRFSAGFVSDYKASPHLALSFGVDFNDYCSMTRTRSMTFTLAANTPAGRASIIGSDPMMSFTTSDAGGTSRALTRSTGWFNKRTETITITPRAEYKRGSLLLEVKGAYSKAVNRYWAYDSGFANVTTNGITGLNFRMERDDPDRPNYKITQLSGPDWADPRNFTNPRISETNRVVANEIYGAQADVRYDLKSTFLSFVKTGVKISTSVRKYDQTSPLRNYSYVGPNGGVSGSYIDYPSPDPWEMNKAGVSFISVSGLLQPPAYPSPLLVGRAFQQHPEYFSQTPPTAANVYSAWVTSRKRMLEQYPAAYLMGTKRFKRLQVQAGVRWEKTVVKSSERNPRPAAEVQAAGFPVTAAGMASTPEGIQYQYLTRPRVWRRGEYENYFPSISGKYSITDNFDAHVGFNKAISRPSVNAIAGVWSINELAQIITLPNPDLRPEQSNNYSARLSYYLRPVGSVAVGVFQNDIRNLREQSEFSAADFGLENDTEFSTYRFISQRNGSGSRRFRGMELEYTQHLSFLPGMWKGVNVSGSYVRNYANVYRGGLVPHRLTAGLGFKYRPLTLRLNAAWASETPWTTTATTNAFRREELKFDLSGGYQLTPKLGLFFTGRNITNVKASLYQYDDNSGKASHLYRYNDLGASWTFGIKGTF